jgi:hypothetical protein
LLSRGTGKKPVPFFYRFTDEIVFETQFFGATQTKVIHNQ